MKIWHLLVAIVVVGSLVNGVNSYQISIPKTIEIPKQDLSAEFMDFFEKHCSMKEINYGWNGCGYNETNMTLHCPSPLYTVCDAGIEYGCEQKPMYLGKAREGYISCFSASKNEDRCVELFGYRGHDTYLECDRTFEKVTKFAEEQGYTDMFER